MGLNTAKRRTLGRQVFIPKPENRKTIIRKPEAFSMRLLHIPILIIKKIVKIKINLYMKIKKIPIVVDYFIYSCSLLYGEMAIHVITKYPI